MVVGERGGGGGINLGVGGQRFSEGKSTWGIFPGGRMNKFPGKGGGFPLIPLVGKPWE